MKTLPADICRCLGGNCNERQTCLRYLRRKDAFPQLSYIASGATDENGKCIYKIEDKPND